MCTVISSKQTGLLVDFSTEPHQILLGKALSDLHQGEHLQHVKVVKRMTIKLLLSNFLKFTVVVFYVIDECFVIIFV